MTGVSLVKASPSPSAAEFRRLCFIAIGGIDYSFVAIRRRRLTFANRENG
jgi:hypothetical protein